MGRRREVPADAAKLRGRIERWRKTRTKRSPMPEPLWDAAVKLAKEHGVHWMSDALRVSYDTLKTRVTRAPKRQAVPAAARTPRFVELMPTAAGGGVVVEVQDGAGARLTIRLGVDAAVDVEAVVRAFGHDGRRGQRR